MSLKTISLLLIALLSLLALVFCFYTVTKLDEIEQVQQLIQQASLEQVAARLEAMGDRAALFLGGILVLAAAIAGLTLWVFLNRIIKPIVTLSSAMQHMVGGDLEQVRRIQLASTSLPREIAEMQDSLQIFQEHEVERRRVQRELQHMAMTDSLTGLANRNQLSRHFLRLSALGRREKKGWAFAMVDLDDFKPINDQYGHAAGDMMLRYAADQIRAACRGSDVVARLGGDEFGVFLYDVADRPSAEVIAARIIQFLHEPVSYDEHTLRVSASVGIALPASAETGLTDIMTDADLALYKAKRAGKNRYVFLEPPVVLGSVVSARD